MSNHGLLDKSEDSEVVENDEVVDDNDISEYYRDMTIDYSKIKAKDELDDSLVPSPTWLDLCQTKPELWKKAMVGFKEETSPTALPSSPNFRTMFSYYPNVKSEFTSESEYREDVAKHAAAFLNSIPGADSDGGNKTIVTLARSLKEGRPLYLADVQRLDALLQRRGHMMRLAETFLDQSCIFCVRVYHPRTRFSQGRYWWPRADGHIIGDLGWNRAYLPDIFEFDVWDFESTVIKNGTRNAWTKYLAILNYARGLEVVEYACLARYANLRIVNDSGALIKEIRQGPEDRFLGFDRECMAFMEAEGSCAIWDKPYKYIAAAWLVSGRTLEEAKTWIYAIHWRHQFDMEINYTPAKFIRPRFNPPQLLPPIQNSPSPKSMAIKREDVDEQPQSVAASHHDK